MTARAIKDAEGVVKIMRLTEAQGGSHEGNPCSVPPCGPGPWGQLLMKILDNERYLIVGAFDDDEQLLAYAVFRNNVNPPVSRDVKILFGNFSDNLETVGEGSDKEMFDLVVEWAKECGAISVTGMCAKVSRLKDLGFKETGMVQMELNI